MAYADGLLAAEGPHADHAVHEDAVPGEETMDLAEHLADLAEGLLHPVAEPLGQVGLDPAHAPVGDGQARPRHRLHQLPQVLAGLDHIEEDGEGPQLHGRGADAREVVADAGDLAHEGADVLAPLGDLDAQQLLDGGGVAEVVDQGRDVVEPVRVGNSVVPAPHLAVLLEGPMQVADLHVGLGQHLAVQLGHDADDPVHGRVRRAHPDGEILAPSAGAAPLAHHELADGPRGHVRSRGR